MNLRKWSVLRYKEQQVYAFMETLVPHAIQIRQTGGPEVLNWTPIEVGEPRPGQECLRQADGGRAILGSAMLTKSTSIHRSLP